MHVIQFLWSKKLQPYKTADTDLAKLTVYSLDFIRSLYNHLLGHLLGHSFEGDDDDLFTAKDRQTVCIENETIFKLFFKFPQPE